LSPALENFDYGHRKHSVELKEGDGMAAQGLNPVEFREGQRTQWNVAATGWKKWSAKIDEAATEVSERMVELAGVESGSRVLDVACGYGEPSLTAAARVGGEGKVVATDIAAEMLAYGRERAAAAGLENIEFVESSASALEFAEGSFDAALSRWGIIFEPDAESALERIRGFLVPGGKMAISSWGEPPQVPMLAIAMTTAMEELDVPPPPPGTPGPLSRPTPEALGGLLEAGGFSGVETEELDLTLDYASAEEYSTFVHEIAPPINALIDPHPPEVREATWAAITEAARQHATDDGSLQLVNRALIAVGSA
jgi:SAM-dependent methyltransferase